MTIQSNDIPKGAVNTKSLATLIIELNIARRNSCAYPTGHPVIAASLTKVLQVYGNLLNKHSKLIIAVTSDALMVEGVILEKSNLVYRDFSRALFEHGIGALLFHPGLTIEELKKFVRILSLKRDQIEQHGGIERVWNKAKIIALSIMPIRYDLFQSTDVDSVTTGHVFESEGGLWDRFARELTHGKLPTGTGLETYLDPEILAEVINRHFSLGSITESEIRNALAVFLPSDDADTNAVTNSNQPHQKMATLISSLNPELRRQFLYSSFTHQNKDQLIATQRMLTNLSDAAILETLEDINHQRLSVSPTIFGLLQRLGHNAGTTPAGTEEIPEDDALSHKMKTILREHASEEFVPGDYQKKLNYIIAADQIPRLNMEEVTDLLKTAENHSIECTIGQILMNLIRTGIETPEERVLLLQNLSDMFSFFLQTGDYGQLHKIIDGLNDGTFPVEIQYRLREEYGQREFLEEILNGLTTWGKPRYDDIRSLIHKIGSPFIEAVLDRLSDEKNMSLRRFYMDCLIEMGPVTRVPIVNRLYDTRWYFLRNLLIVLSAQNDPSILPLIQPLVRSKDPRLRHEALKTLMHFHDPLAEQQVLDDLDNQNQEKHMFAIQLAEQCTTPAIANKLITLLSQGGFSQIDYERKSAIVQALGEIGRSEVLPELAKILSSRSLLHSRQLTKLKVNIIRSLPKYPPNVSRPVLEHIANDSGEIARLAAETLKTISGKPL